MFKITPKNIRDIKPAITMRKILDYWVDDEKDVRDELHRIITEMILNGNPGQPRVRWDNITE